MSFVVHAAKLYSGVCVQQGASAAHPCYQANADKCVRAAGTCTVSRLPMMAHHAVSTMGSLI